MDVNSVLSGSPDLSGNSGSDKSDASLAQNFDTFLTLLTTQLQNQDPLNPMDSSEFTQQLVSYSQVEQAMRTNDQLETLIDITTQGSTAESFSNLVGYLGKKVTMDTNVAGLRNGKADWKYSLDSKADEVTISVRNEADEIVYTTSGETDAGEHAFTWDGTTNNGLEAPDGAYAIKIEAKTDGGSKVESTVFVEGLVESAETELGIHKLIVDGAAVPLGALMKVESVPTENS